MKKSIDSAKHLALLGLGRSRINNLALPLLAMLLVVGALALFTTDGAVQAADPPTASSPLVVTNVEGGSECNSGATGLPSTSTLSVGGSDNKFKGGTPATDDPPWAIWANANEDPKEETLDIPGSHQVIHGLVQSRGHLKMGGVRIAAGWVRELQGRWLGSIGVDWRSADGLQSPHRAPMALCGSCDARDGERIRSRELSQTGVARVCGEVGAVAGWQSGGEWNGSQSGHGASELGFPRPMLGKMQGKAARRAGDPSHQSEEPPPEGFGGRDPFTQADAGCPAGQVVRHHLYRQPGAVGAHRDVFHSSCPALERLPQLTSFGPPMVARRL